MGKLQTNLNGIRNMNKLPGIMFVVDPHNEDIAVAEARKLNIPIVAVVDTNCDPDLVDYVIPGNDDAIRAIQLFASVIADAVIEGRQGESFGGAEKREEAPAAETAEEVKAEEEAPAVQEAAAEEVALTPEEALEKAIAEKENEEK